MINGEYIMPDKLNHIILDETDQNKLNEIISAYVKKQTIYYVVSALSCCIFLGLIKILYDCQLKMWYSTHTLTGIYAYRPMFTAIIIFLALFAVIFGILSAALLIHIFVIVICHDFVLYKDKCTCRKDFAIKHLNFKFIPKTQFDSEAFSAAKLKHHIPAKTPLFAFNNSQNYNDISGNNEDVYLLYLGWKIYLLPDIFDIK